jgi:hypothetical protein
MGTVPGPSPPLFLAAAEDDHPLLSSIDIILRDRTSILRMVGTDIFLLNFLFLEGTIYH